MKKKILSLLVLLALVCAALPACAQDEYFTAVIDGDTSDRVHLRAEPSTEAKSLGLYFTGTQAVCRVLDGGEWAEAAIGTARLQKQQGFCQQDQDITRILICQEYFNKILVKID